MATNSEKGVLTEKTSVILIWVGISLLLFLTLMFVFLNGFIEIGAQIDSNKFDHFGSIVGGFVGAIWSLAGVIMFYIALKEQKKATETGLDALSKQSEALLLQQKEYELQRQELEQTRMVFVEQSHTFKIQQFESTFFNLLNLHHQIVNSIDVVAPDGTKEIVNQISETRRRIAYENKYKEIKSRDCFEYFYQQFKFYYAPQNLSKPIKLEQINQAYIEFYKIHQSDLAHYFRNLYNILKFIDKKNPGDKYFYSNMLRAQLSAYELILIFYNCLSQFGREKFKPLIEKYHFLQNMPKLPLVNKTDIELYDAKAFGKPENNSNDRYSSI